MDRIVVFLIQTSAGAFLCGVGMMVLCLSGFLQVTCLPRSVQRHIRLIGNSELVIDGRQIRLEVYIIKHRISI